MAVLMGYAGIVNNTLKMLFFVNTVIKDYRKKVICLFFRFKVSTNLPKMGLGYSIQDIYWKGSIQYEKLYQSWV